MSRTSRAGRDEHGGQAGVSGYDLYRQITGLGVACQVIAPALTPRRPGQRIKTDKRDAKKLVRLFRAGELTAIRVPGEAEEGVRDFVRGREDVRRDVLRWRHRVVKFLDRHGRRYLAGRNWTGRHWTWLRSQRFEVAALQRTLEVSLITLEQALARQAELDREIEALAQSEPYREPVGWLRGFRGIDTLAAMIPLVEIGDFHRFQRPRQLMAHLGLVPSEYSSGDRERRGALTKAGNTHPRRAVVEAAWHIGTARGSGGPWPTGARGNPTPAGTTRGTPSTACIGATAAWWGTASGRRSRWPRSRANWSGSSGWR